MEDKKIEVNRKGKLVFLLITVTTLAVMFLGILTVIGLFIHGLDDTGFKEWVFYGMFPIFLAWVLGLWLTDTSSLYSYVE